MLVFRVFHFVSTSVHGQTGSGGWLITLMPCHFAMKYVSHVKLSQIVWLLVLQQPFAQTTFEINQSVVFI